LGLARDLEVIEDGVQRVVLAVEADVADPCGRHEPEHAFDHPEPRPEDRHEGELLPTDRVADRPLERRVDRHGVEGKVSGHLVAHERRDLLDKVAKQRLRSVTTAEQRDLVLDERMLDDDEIRIRFHVRSVAPFAGSPGPSVNLSRGTGGSRLGRRGPGRPPLRALRPVPWFRILPAPRDAPSGEARPSYPAPRTGAVRTGTDAAPDGLEEGRMKTGNLKIRAIPNDVLAEEVEKALIARRGVRTASVRPGDPGGAEV